MLSGAFRFGMLPNKNETDSAIEHQVFRKQGMDRKMARAPLCRTVTSIVSAFPTAIHQKKLPVAIREMAEFEETEARRDRGHRRFGVGSEPT
jgi:hypothetical protein